MKQIWGEAVRKETIEINVLPTDKVMLTNNLLERKLEYQGNKKIF